MKITKDVFDLLRSLNEQETVTIRRDMDDRCEIYIDYEEVTVELSDPEQVEVVIDFLQMFSDQQSQLANLRRIVTPDQWDESQRR